MNLCQRCGGIREISYTITVTDGKPDRLSLDPALGFGEFLCGGHPSTAPEKSPSMDLSENDEHIALTVLKEMRTYAGHGYTDAYEDTVDIQRLAKAIKRSVDHHREGGCYHEPQCERDDP